MRSRGADDDAGDVDDCPIRITLSVPLPCGMGGCRRPAREALVEPDPTCRGAWLLLPICPACAVGVRADVRRIALS